MSRKDCTHYLIYRRAYDFRTCSWGKWELYHVVDDKFLQRLKALDFAKSNSFRHYQIRKLRHK